MPIIDDLAAGRTTLLDSTTKLKAIVDGPATGDASQVETDSGTVKTIARVQAEAMSAAVSGWQDKSANFDAVTGGRYRVDTSAGPVTATLTEIGPMVFQDAAGTWGTNALTLDGDGQFFDPVEDEDDQYTCDIPGATVTVELRDGVLTIE